jgi:superfamily II DNA or RNA helicase
MKSKISNKGYIIYKDDFSEKELKKTKKTLNVSPYSPYQSKFTPPPSFPVYQESKRKLYLPRHWGLSNLGKTDNIQIKDGFDINLDFKGDLRPIQKEAIDAYIKNCYPEFGGGILCLGCGSGKSLSRDTPVIMYDGSIKMIQDVKVGDQLMGDDSTPRNVLNLGRGMEMMYDIVPTKGDTYTVNESHILSLKCSTERGNKFKMGEIYDISLKDYINLPKSYHYPHSRLKTYRVGVEFETKIIEIEPYYLGNWLVTEQYKFEEIIDTETYKLLKKMNLIKNKHIPYNYKCNNRKIRLELLAGIIDGISNTYHNGYDIIVNSEKLLDDIIYLARSLGFASYKQIKKTNIKNNFIYRTNIHGIGLKKIPIKLDKNKTHSRKQIKDALVSGIKVVPKGVDYYYGVELDGNHRYLLGSFTVTHNTVIALNLVSQLKKKALIVVHKEFLLNQWIERIKMFLPTAQVGRIQGKTFDITGKDIVIGMLQSLSMKTYDEDAFDSFGTTICDEVHHLSSEVFSRALPKISTKYTLGLTATPNRADGLQKVFEWFLGPIVYQGKRKHTHDVFVKIIEIQDTDKSYCKLEEGYDGRLVTSRMINNVANYRPRTDIIIEEVKNIMLEPGRKILILSDRRDHLKLMKELLTELEFDVGFYLGGMKQKDLDISETKPIILGTFSMSSEALDIPELNTLFMTTPKSNIEQSVGRILRKQHEIRPLIIDIKDNFKPFSNQFTKRKTFYKKCKYQMKEITIKSNNYIETITENKDLHNLILDSQLDITIDCKEKKQSNLTEFLMISDDD